MPAPIKAGYDMSLRGYEAAAAIGVYWNGDRTPGGGRTRKSHLRDVIARKGHEIASVELTLSKRKGSQ